MNTEKRSVFASGLPQFNFIRSAVKLKNLPILNTEALKIIQKEKMFRKLFKNKKIRHATSLNSLQKIYICDMCVFVCVCRERERQRRIQREVYMYIHTYIIYTYVYVYMYTNTYSYITMNIREADLEK